MATFGELEIDKFYLIRTKPEAEITMVQVGMQTETCVFVYEFDDEYESTFWKKKVEEIAEVVEELTEAHVDAYEALLEEDEDEDEDYGLDFDEEDFDSDDSDDDDDDDDDDEDEEEEPEQEEKKKKKKKKK